MSEENAIALATPDTLRELLAATPDKYASEGAMTAVCKVGDWLPYISLYQGSSREVKKKIIPMGHFGLREGKTIVDLGEEIVIYVLAERPKAMQFLPKVLSFFDTKSEQFKEIQNRALHVKNSNCGSGPEFLVWLPNQQKLATYFMGNATMRNESANVRGPFKDKGPVALLQKSDLIDNGEHSWFGPKTSNYDHDFVMPPMERLAIEVPKFKNPPASAEDTSEAAGEAETGRR